MLRNSFWTLIVLIVLSSCSVEKWCAEKYPPVTSDSTYTKTDTLTMYDTVFVPYREVVLDTTFAFIPPEIVFHSEKKKNGLTSTVDIRKGKLTFKCAADSLQEIIESKNLEINTFNQKKEVKWLPCDKEHKTKFNHFCSYWFWITAGLLLIWLIIKILKSWFSV